MLFFDRCAIGRIRHQHGFAQMFGGLAGVFQQVAFELLQARLEERQLRCVHVVLVAHLEELFLGDQRHFRVGGGSVGFRGHFDCFRYGRFADSLVGILVNFIS